MNTTSAYNPLEKLNLAKSIVDALFEEPARSLLDTESLVGAGIYAIYYTGPFALYAGIAALNKDGKFGQPIYVGKAIPKGGRKGGLTKDSTAGDVLRTRIRIHAASIAEASNLEVADFHFRALVVDDVWIPLGENAVIEWFKPVWNLALDGFGIKVPGRGRLKQKTSDWDTVHPGRKLAEGLAPNSRTQEELVERVRTFLATGSQGNEAGTSADDNDEDEDDEP